MNRIAITLDLESDYATGRYDCLRRAEELVHFLRSSIGDFTVFCEGALLRLQHPLIGTLRDAGAEIQLHCYNHFNGPDGTEDLKRGLAAYKQYFGHVPSGYRAGNFRINPDLLDVLRGAGVQWDSSFQTRHVGHRSPFELPNGMLEFPVTSIGSFPLPSGMGYLSFAGPLIYRFAKDRWLREEYVNLYCHMHDLFPCESLGIARPGRRVLHSWNYRFGFRDPLQFFFRIVEDFLSEGFSPTSLSRIYREIRTNGD